MASSRRRRRLAANGSALGAGAAFVLVAAWAGSAHAALELRFRVETRGDLRLLGNTLAAECAADVTGGVAVPPPLVGTLDCRGVRNVADTAPDVFWRSDFPGPGQALADGSVTLADARSSARLELPAGARPLYARLYWAGYLEDASGSADAGVVLETDASSAEVAADASAVVVAQDGVRYQSSADVTHFISEAGSVTVRVSGVDGVDLAASTDANDEVFSAWWMAVFYATDGDPVRTLSLFDGLDRVDDQTRSSTLASGLGVVDAGFDAELGVVAFEGDASLSGDALLVDGVALSDALNPADDFFNSTRSELGAPVSLDGDLPRLSGGARSMSGLDLDLVDVTARLAPGLDSPLIVAESSADTLFLGGLVSRVSQLRPDFGATTLDYRDLDGGVVARGDEIQYTIEVRNIGSDASAGTELTDTLAEGLAYSPGSLRIERAGQSLPQSDAAGDDLAEFDAATRRLTVRLGTGASPSSGGEVSPGEDVVVVFRVRVERDAPASIANRATIQASGVRGSPAASFASDGDANQVGAQATVFDVSACEVDADCGGGAPRCDVAEGRYVCVACLEDSDCRAPESPVCLAERVCACPPERRKCPPDPDAGTPEIPAPDAAPPPHLEQLKGSGISCGLVQGTASGRLAAGIAAGLAMVAALRRRRRPALEVAAAPPHRLAWGPCVTSSSASVPRTCCWLPVAASSRRASPPER